MLSNNKTSLILTKDIKKQSKIKHIDVIYLYIQELVNHEELDIKFIYAS